LVGGDVAADGSVEGTRKALASLLAEAGVASEDALRSAAIEGMAQGERLGEIVLRRGWIDETGLARLLARQWELPFLSDEEVEVAAAAVEVLPLECAQRTGACVTAVRNGGPAVAIAEPNEQRFAELRALLAAEPTFVVVTPTTLTRLLEQLAAAEADAKLQDAAAAASEAEQAQADTLLGELDAVTAVLGTLRRGMDQLAQRRHLAEQQLADCRSQLAELARERALEQERIIVLGRQRSEAQARFAAVKAKLRELLAGLDD
jgi:Type II secretion system (T2SS), protein E, N-terminal domain